MSKQSDETLGWLVLLGFLWWFLETDDPPAWAWVLVIGGVLVVVVAVLQSEPVQNWWQRHRERKLAQRLSIHGVDAMNGHQFERYVATMLEEQGYSVERHGGSADRGADAIASRGGARFVVQAKHRGPGRTVGPRTVRATRGAKELHNCNRSMVVTNRYFTDAAQEQAGEDCMLVDRENLAEWIAQ